MNYFKKFCKNHCMASSDVCNECPIADLEDYVNNIIWDLEDKNTRLQQEVNTLRRLDLYGEDEEWKGELRY